MDFSRKPSPLQSRALYDSLGILLLIVFLVSTPPLSSDPGVGWHLKTGEQIARNLTIPYQDPFLWTSQGKEWISNQWLADLILYGIFSLAGWGGLATFCFALPLLSMLLFQTRIIESYQRSDSLLQRSLPFVLLSLGLLIAWVQWIARPVVFSFALFSLVYYLVWQFINRQFTEAQGSAAKYFLIKISIIFLFWSNLHSAFPLGLGLLLIGALSIGWQQKSFQGAAIFVCAFLIGLAATFINPYGWNLHRNIIDLVGQPYFMTLNKEWLPPDFLSQVIFMPAGLFIAIFTLLMLLLRLSSLQFLSGSIFCLLAITGVRYIPFLGLIVPCLLISQKKELGRAASNFIPWGSVMAAVVIFTVLATSSSQYSQKFSSKIIDKPELWQAVDQICQKHQGKIYNHPDLGGAITFMLWPSCQAAIDDRNELNGVAAYQRFFEISKGDFSKLEEIGVSAAILNCGILKEETSSWRKISEFDEYCIYEKVGT